MSRKWLVLLVMIVMGYFLPNVSNASDLYLLAPYILPFDQTGGSSKNYHEWAAVNGHVRGYNQYGHGVIEFRFRLDDESLKTLCYTPTIGGAIYRNFGLEVDVSEVDSEKLRFGEVWYSDNFPGKSNPIVDTNFLDDVTNPNNSNGRGLLIRDANYLEKNQDYIVYFYLKDLLPEGGVRINPTLQISADTDMIEKIITHAFGAWFPFESVGSYLDKFEYFVLESDSYEENWKIYPNGYEGICWENKRTSFPCRFDFVPTENHGDISAERELAPIVLSHFNFDEPSSQYNNSPTLTPHLHIFRSGEDHELDPDRHTVYVGEMLDFEVIIKSEEEIKDQLDGDDHLRIDLDYDAFGDWQEIEDFSAKKENLDETRHTEYATWRVPDDGETRIRFRIHIDNTGQTITTDWFDVRKRQFDGIVSNVSAPTRAYANQNVDVTVTVTNNGSETPTEETQLAIYLPDSSGNFKRKSNFVDIGPAELASGDSLARTFNIVMSDQPGTYVFAAYYDPRLKGDEMDEKNNIKTFSITVSPASPDLYVVNRWLDEGGAVRKGKDAHANCTVGNIGIATPTAKDVHVHYLFDGREVDDDEFKSHHVTPGHSRTVEDRGGFKMKNSGTHTYTCCADPHNRISESNESNNCSSMTFTVK